MRIRTLNNPFSCRQRFEKQPWESIFPAFKQTLDVEIGVGGGDFIEYYASTHPERSIVGYEIRYRAFEHVQQRLQNAQLTNAHVCWGHGQIGLQDMFDDNSISKMFIFHPDPWPKNKHSNRRLINPDFLDTVYTKLAPGGLIYLATDVAELWDYMHATIIAHKKFTLLEQDSFWQEHYHTRWREISERDNRTLNYGTFKKLD